MLLSIALQSRHRHRRRTGGRVDTVADRRSCLIGLLPFLLTAPVCFVGWAVTGVSTYARCGAVSAIVFVVPALIGAAMAMRSPLLREEHE
ncbi:hypothetical protein H4N58_17125 [Mumia sp. ZJ1417]|uniref:hypothetical protein n=1 Tax=Mumia sp. ZJ1417 TaxID=2708082 RepID=UPI00141FA518|nr:hypothetical protein [Mumia sp. ZJ1417]QMW65861.1 hypothetical protein H4N58_17125 [Mumia sp. ZJ1417]